jgi:hypothetical protein
MTTGSINIPGRYPTKNFGMFRNWSGGDGKYLADGRDKWNNYSLLHYQESDQYGPATSAVSTLSGIVYTWSGADEMRLQSKLVRKIKDHEFNLAVNLAQSRQLVGMCASLLRKLGRSLVYLKHGQIAPAFRELGVSGNPRPLKSTDVSGRWLEMQYGWLPAVSDAYQAAKAFEAISQGRKARVVATEKVGRPYNGSASPTLYSCMGNTTVIKRIVCELEEELSASRSLGLLDPLSVVWEILPYSFVFDWFLPVGTYLSNLAVIPHLKGRFLSTTYSRTEARFTALLNPAYTVNYGGAVRRGLSIELTRTASLSLTTQRPTFVGPVDAMSPKRIANAVSLCHQALFENTLEKGLRFLDIPF